MPERARRGVRRGAGARRRDRSGERRRGAGPGGRAAAGRGGGFRSRGMRDLGPERMRRFRRVEARFLEVASAAGYREIRTPTVEPLHLFTGAGALSPQLLDRVYSFLDWDGWSGERVVLRPDSTLPAVRWFGGQADAPDAGSGAAARLCYVQPVYRFSAGDEPRELWQCGSSCSASPRPGGRGAAGPRARAADGAGPGRAALRARARRAAARRPGRGGPRRRGAARRLRAPARGRRGRGPRAGVGAPRTRGRPAPAARRPRARRGLPGQRRGGPAGRAARGRRAPSPSCARRRGR